ncbi:hypothetical protein Deba_1265 [Desulfarculus baarsii DSM 2075]|uniref:DUF2325 domain-containing protein n=1 Tax=Desulfarculus baarsii (strain ATCC 33931 / DSM 2075 / LMG 7858 / VKM B-1802 / 2st14) TaxID=644282 RepID=E1QG23_DESB2|nr:hypothetical protein Deba_1265 [Desulfarculus baarsii DSM 2075]
MDFATLLRKVKLVMPSLINTNAAKQPETHPDWHCDQLTLTVLLNGALGPKAMAEMLAATEPGSAAQGMTVHDLLPRLHLACREVPAVAGAVAAHLDRRFRREINKLRRLNPEAAQARLIGGGYRVGALWACLRHQNEAVRGMAGPLAAEMLGQGMACLRPWLVSDDHARQMGLDAGQRTSLGRGGRRRSGGRGACAVSAQCACCPLQGLKVAVIGGLERMEGSYCQAIDKLGGQCSFHPGHVRGGSRRLRQIVIKSDVVVFITSVNSHGALATVKAECKKAGKPFIALGRTGVGSLEEMLLEFAA